MRQSAPLSPSQPWYRTSLGSLLLFVSAALVIYAPAVGAYFIWDDDLWIINNPNLRSFQGLIDTWFSPRSNPEYYPVTLSVFWVEYQLWGLWSTGYHVVNIVLHATNAYLIGLVLTRLHVRGAWLAAVLFLVHPVNVETVAWVTEHKNTLSGILLALSLVMFTKAFGLDQPEGKEPSANRVNQRALVASVAFYTLAVLAKTVAVTLPGVLLVILWWKRRLVRQNAIHVIPYLVVGLPLAGFAVWMQHIHTGASAHSVTGIEFAFTFPERLAIASRAPWFYLGKLIWPWPLAFIYPKWQLDGGQWQQFIGFAATVAVLLTLLLVRNRLGRGPLAAFLIYGGMLFPAIGFFNVFWFRYTFVADHVQYHASVAMLALIAATLAKLLDARPTLHLATAGVLLLVLGILTFVQSRFYYDNERLMRRTAELNPYNQFPHGILGHALREKGRLDEAVTAFETSLKYTPAVPYRQSRAEYWLAHVLEEGKRFADAVPHYQAALTADPTFVNARYNLANCLRELKRYGEAIEQYQLVIAAEPEHVHAWNNLAYSFLSTSQLDDAIAAYEQTLRLAPNLAPAHAGLRQAMLRKQHQSR